MTKENESANREVEQFLEKVGQTINGQMTITYDTKQTLEQFLEIRKQSEGVAEFDEELFLEYVLDNVAEQIRNEVQHNGQRSLYREISLVSGEGEYLTT
jgi:uncharacterized phage infection (PIP) family protein YhgE